MLDAGYLSLVTGCWSLVIKIKRYRVSRIRKAEWGRWSIIQRCKAQGSRRQPSSRYGVTMARQAGLKLQGIKIRHLTLFNSTFRIPNSEFKYICPLTSEICHLEIQC